MSSSSQDRSFPSSARALLLGLTLSLGLASGCAGEVSADEPSAAFSTRQEQLAGEGFTFVTTNMWQAGYCAEMRVTNGTGGNINGWTVRFELIPGMTVTSLWQGRWTSQGSLHTVSDLGWNAALPAGAANFFGFCGTHTGTVSPPLRCTLNGQPCGGGSAPPPPPPPPADTQPPTVVSGLSVLSKAPRSVELAWQAATDNVGVTGYEVFLNGAAAPVASPAGTSVSVAGLTPGTTYTFTVKARDAAGNRSVASAPLTVTTPSSKKLIGYFASWGVYGRAFNAKKLYTSGAAAKLTHLNYAFGNVVNGRCNILQSDPWADYQLPFDVLSSVDGLADAVTQPLKGNFNQLRKLKAKNPHLKVLISLGGWTWSGGFSDAVSTAERRQAFVQSCIDLYIRGNLPGLPAGAAAGVFDGIDIDWEYPAANGMYPGRPEDTVNFTLMLAEFRRQLDAVRPGLQLSIATGAGADKYTKIQLNQIHAYVDHVSIMAYDMHGSWDTATNFHAPLYNQSANPERALRLSLHEAVSGHLAGGIPASKLVVGVPFYGRGWQGAQAGPTGNGLYQQTRGPAWGNWDDVTTGATGMFDYYYIRNVLEPAAVKYRHPEAQVPYLYNPTTRLWVSYDDPISLGAKGDYINGNNLGGAMLWELSGDDAQGSLLTALKNKLNPY
jgi:chitinase